MFALRYRVPRAAFLAFAISAIGWSLTAAADTARAEKYALLIGVKQYSEAKELRPLPYSETDVTELAQVLRDGGYRPENVVLMTQTIGAQTLRYLPLQHRIRKELQLFLKQRSEEDTVLIALAGHGVHFKDDEKSYFCPVDAVLTDRTTLIALGEVYHELELCKARVKVLLVDACRNDPLVDKSRARAEVELESVTRPPLPTPPGGVVAFFSCSEREKAFEHDKLKHGVFFHFVIEGLKGEASAGKGEVTLLGLGEYVTMRVGDFVRAEYGVTQTPELVGKSRGAVALVSLDGRVTLLLAEGRELLKQKEHDRAIAKLSEALRLNPRFASAYFQRGRAYQDKGDYDRAIADYTEVIRLNPKDANVCNSRGNAYLEKGDHDRALADFNEAIRLDPKHTKAYLSRGVAYQRKRDHDRAIADFTEAIRLNPNFDAAYFGRGVAYQEKGDHDRAIAEYTEAIRLDPQNATAHNNRGNAYLHKDDQDRAIPDFNEAIRLNPKYVFAYWNRAIAYERQGDLKKAEADRVVARKLRDNR